MSRALPITLAFFTSTKQHFGFKDIYRTTLNHLDRQLPISWFGQRVVSLKVTPGDEAIAADMVADLERRGFEVLTTVGNWSRGQSHQKAYMDDVVKLSKHPSVYKQPYVLWLEDDSTISPHQCSVEDLLLRGCQMLAEDNELTSVRLLRATDLGTSPSVGPIDDGRFFYSPHVNFQPLTLRSRDFYLAARFVEENPQAAAQVQCEALWRAVLEPFSRSEKRHLVWHPSYAETIHLGVADYPALKASLNL